MPVAGQHAADGRRLRLHAAHSRAPARRSCRRRSCPHLPKRSARGRRSAEAASSSPRARSAVPGGARTASPSSCSTRAEPLAEPRRHARRRASRSGSIRPGSTGAPKGTVHPHANLYWTAELYGKRVLGMRESDVVLLRRQAVLRLRPRQRADLPAVVGATTVLMAGAADAAARVQAPDASSEPTVFFGVPTLLRRRCSPRRPARARAGRAAPVRLGRRGAAARHRRALHRAFRLRDPRRHRLDRDAAHLPVEPARRRALRHHRQAGARLRPANCAATTARQCRDGEIGELLHQRAERGADVLEQPREDRARPSRASGRAAATSTSRDADGYYIYAGRSDDMLKVGGIYVSPFEVEAALVQHPAVLEAAVIGAAGRRRPDQDRRRSSC